MNILIADEHILFREGLVSLLAKQSDLTIVGEAGSAREAVQKTFDLNPDLAIMDIHFADGDGLEVIRTIRSRRPETKIVVLTSNDSEDLFISAVRSGAIGYLPKNIAMSKLLLSLHAIIRGEAALSRTMTSRLLVEFQRLGKTHNEDKIDLEILTPREIEVLGHLSTNASNQEIAEKLIIAENTVKVHVHNILEKLNFQNRREAGRFARRQGIEPFGKH